jgi:hypothetical protein
MILDIDDTFCAAHGGQQLAFWNAHHNERGFASMHIYHVQRWKKSCYCLQLWRDTQAGVALGITERL